MKNIFCFLLLSLLISCVTPTRITGSWKNPAHSTKVLRHIYIAALTSNTIARSVAETEMAAALEKYGVKTTRSMTEFPPGNPQDTIRLEKVMDSVRKDEADAILTIILIKKKSETRYVPGSYAYDPAMRYYYYGRFAGYYSYWYPFMYDPGYYTEDEVYFIESNLYDVATDELIWSAQSKTYNPSGFHPFSKEFAETIAAKLKKDGLIPEKMNATNAKR